MPRCQVRQAIVGRVIGTCAALDRQIVAEGVETRAVPDTLRRMGIRLFQSYLLARPQTEALPAVDYSVLDA